MQFINFINKNCLIGQVIHSCINLDKAKTTLILKGKIINKYTSLDIIYTFYKDIIYPMCVSEYIYI